MHIKTKHTEQIKEVHDKSNAFTHLDIKTNS